LPTTKWGCFSSFKFKNFGNIFGILIIVFFSLPNYFGMAWDMLESLIEINIEFRNEFNSFTPY